MAMKTKITLFAVLLLSACGWAKYSGGSGTAEDPYLIATVEDLNSIGLDSNDWDKHFLMTADINMAGITGDQFNAIGYYEGDESPNNAPFCGFFDGNGHNIENFEYEANSSSFIGLFALAEGVDTVIKDITLIDVNVTGEVVVGALAGRTECNVINCAVEGGKVSGEIFVGGLIGHNLSYVQGCRSSCEVSGDTVVGGLIGGDNGVVVRCFSSSSVSGTNSTGGLVGVPGVFSGIFGGSQISNCYSTGTVVANHTAGGLVGDVVTASISNCYAVGVVQGYYSVGAFAGPHWDIADYTSCFWDTNVNPGLPGIGDESDPNVIGLPTAEMKKRNTFADAGWDMVNVWDIVENQTYPFLRTNPPGDWAKYSGGTGEPNDPYLIATPEDLNSVGLHPEDFNKCFLMTADINMAGIPGDSFNIIGNSEGGSSFEGIFDGNGHSILNFNLSAQGTFIGMFGWVYNNENARIEGVTLLDPNISAWGSMGAGALVGSIWSGTISNCHVIGGDVKGIESVWVGGLCGAESGMESATCNIVGCTSSANVYGEVDAGGLIGTSVMAAVSNCSASCNVYCISGYAGGLIGGETFDVDIINCNATGDVNGRFAGGLIGFSQTDTTVQGCFASGNVKGDSSIGGLIGDSMSGNVCINCYATGDVEGEAAVGGLIGSYRYGSVINCYATGDVNGGSNGFGGLIGYFEGDGSVINCHATGNVDGGEFDTGGLIGAFLDGSIIECYALGNVTGELQVGGLAGAGSGQITRSFSTGLVYGSDMVGGLTGSFGGDINDCYSLGNVTGLNQAIGGLSGYCSGTVTNCYAAGVVDGNEYTGALDGYSSSSVYAKCFWDQTKNPDVNGIGNSSDPDVIGLPTAEMQLRSTFADAGWDMVNVWDIGENQTYPFLRTHLSSDINKDGETNLYDLVILALNWLEE
jgi:hypothetical protein